MSVASSKKSATLNQVGWGPVEAILLGLVGFLAMQLIVAIVLGVVLASANVPRTVLDSNTFNFVAYAIVSLGAATPIWFFLRSRHLSWRRLGFDRPVLRKLIWSLPAFGLYFVTASLVYAIVAVFAPSIDLEQAQELGFQATEATGQLVMIFVSLVVIPPVIEEAVFRGFLFRGLRQRLSLWPSAIISGLAFGLAHWQLNIGLDTAVLGIVSAWLLERTGSLWPSIALHGLKNLVAFALVFIFSV